MSKKTLQNKLETLVIFKYLLLNVASNLLRKKHLQGLLQPDTDLVCSSASEPIRLGLQRQSVKYMDPGRVIYA